MRTTLVICLGNEARGDDGAGHEVGRRLIASATPDMRVLAAAGLDVAMLEDVAGVDTLIVVDAERRTAPLVTVSAIEARDSATPTGHSVDAPGLLALAASLYGATPEARLVTLAAPEMEHGEGLSATAEKAVAEAVDVVARSLRT